MTENGDDIPEPRRISRLADLANGPVPEAVPGTETAPEPALESGPEVTPVTAVARAVAESGPAPGAGDQVTLARREFARLLGEFRRTAVLVPFDAQDSLWTADFNGVRWICAFSDEEALARFAVARGEAGREWSYRTILGARLLDVMVPILPGPAGVALDAGSVDGALFPPVAGIVPDEVAVDLGGAGTGAETGIGAGTGTGAGAR
ncbi:SseB family protein [Streptomyces lateritius]|uniref:SseB family protein n=1 Tax=Streptomyces lateritius TaxID=67313 RepID=UPI001C8B4457|nr:SseB family protein [Streptomyces lateritius]MBX9424237.1 SseB family protein [Streptomyces lateritius]